MVSSLLYKVTTGTINYLWSCSFGKKTIEKKFKKVSKKSSTPKVRKIVNCTNVPKGSKSSKSTKGVLYAFGTHKNRYKVGKTVNLSQRMRSYRTIYPDGLEYHVIKCSDIHQSEKILHSMLKLGGFHFKQEIFDVKGEVLKAYMNIVEALDKMVEKEYSCEKMRKIADFMNNII